MADYPELRFTDPITGDPKVAVPTGRFKIEFTTALAVSELLYLLPLSPEPVTAGLALAAIVEFPLGLAAGIGDIRTLAAERDEIRRILPIYEVDGHEFMPLPGTVLIRADTRGDAELVATELAVAVNALPDGDGNVLESIGEFIPGSGVFEFAVGGGSYETGPVEPGFGLFAVAAAYDRGYDVCIDAEHPIELATEVECRVGYTDYADRYDDPPTTRMPVAGAKVAVLDSFFELDHAAIGFQQDANQAINERRGLSTLDLEQCSVDAHGTSCAGVIGAFGADAESAAAVGELEQAEIIPIRVFEYGLKGFEEVALAKGIRGAVNAGAGVISISLATPVSVSCALGPAVDYAIDNDVVVVAGTGNAVRGTVDGNYRDDPPTPIDYPAAFDGVLAVGAAKVRNGTLARVIDAQVENLRWQSKHGIAAADAPSVSVVAPGLEVRTTSLYEPLTPPPGNLPRGFWAGFQGTSAAAPIVAGLAARIRAELQLDARRVRERIECLAEQVPGFKAHVTRVTGGDRRSYSYELGFGWIDRKLASLDCVIVTPRIAMFAPRPEPEPGEGKKTMADNTAESHSGDCVTPDCEGLAGGGPQVGHCSRPVTEFLKLLADRDCCELLYEFLDNPFLAARNAGVPYSAAVWLGTGDWERVNQALMAENRMDEGGVATIVGGLGPIWVKAT